MLKITWFFLCVFIFFSCSKNDLDDTNPENTDTNFVSAVDISSYPEIQNTNPKFYDNDGNEKQFLTILKESGINTIRLRMWVNPENNHSGYNEVKQLSQSLKSIGFKTWLTIHYSDTWADPGQQKTPEIWTGIPFSNLRDSVYSYTKKIVQNLDPDYIQIGNEINSGFLHPNGNLIDNYNQFIELMEAGISAVRENSSESKIIIHFAGIENSGWFFNQINTLDYDIIGLSYYPIWHGKSIKNLKSVMQNLSIIHNKKVVVAETAYPFTLDWNDWTNNIVGLENQLILPDFPASKIGQQNFVNTIKNLVKELENGIGFCYWGGELISWKGDQATDASPWENQALFDFNNKALPVLNEFEVD